MPKVNDDERVGAASDTSAAVGLRKNIAVLRRRWRTAAVVAGVVFGLAVVYALSRTPMYEADSLVLLSRQSVANQLSGGAEVGLQQQSFQQVLVTQSRLARTPEVLQGAIQGAGGTRLSSSDLADASDATADPSSDLLTFTVRSENSQQAIRLSDAYARAYVDYRRRLDSAALESALKDLTRALRNAESRGASGVSLVNRLSASRQELQTRIALQTANAQVVASPVEATKIRPVPRRAAVLGLFFGLLAGLAAAFLRDGLDNKVRSAEDVAASLSTSLLGHLGAPPRKAADSGGLVMLHEPAGSEAEAFRMLRSNLSFGVSAHDVRRMAVTSSTAGEGKSTTIANLAVAFAAAGRNVVLADFDLRKPTLSALFGIAAGPGVTEVAQGEVPLESALVEIDVASLTGSAASPPRGSLRVLPAGAMPPDPSEFLASQHVETLVSELASMSDLLLLDSPPILAVSDASTVLSYADAVFLCVRIGVARRTLLGRVQDVIRRAGVPVLGHVVTGDRDREGGEAYYYYGHEEAQAARRG